MENVLELTHLKKYYGQTRAVEDVSFSVKPGEVVVIIGPSGAGKSTVLRCINRMIDPTEGTILFQGTDMAQVKRERDLKAIRRRIGMIFQSFNLVYRLSVFQNVLHGRLGYMSTPNAVLGRYSEADKEKALELLRMIGLEGMLYKKAGELSGGQKQRAALAGVLALNPEILIFDEATSMLDPKGRREVLAEMKKLRDCGKTVVMITHDVEEAVLADRVILMGCPNGQKNPNTVLAQGSVREILTDSRLLIQAGIVPPMAVRMYEDLKLAGIELNRCPLTKEELAEALCRWKSEN